ncbi:MAG: DUF3999 domain-containing protein [Desulfosalsimonadaceae bacterium]|nr:DUF3999 domain-containing protein [Desulfosalsimonadaceae bacterium]
MKNFVFVLLVFAAALFLLPSVTDAGATALQPSDFAYGMPISLPGNGAVYRLSIPREVYGTVARNDMNDIRIFNSASAVVPHALRLPENKNGTTEVANPLPFFPLYTDETKGWKDGLSVRIEQGKDGAIINVEEGDAKSGKDRKPSGHISGYIIDASRQTSLIHDLDITWQTEAENFVTTVSVESSNDLTHWSTPVPRATLARMRFSGHEISRKRIRLPADPARYLRLSWPAGAEGVAVAEILGVQRRGEPERERVWTAFQGKPGPHKTKPEDAKKGITAYDYDSAARLPVDRVRLRFAEKNTLVSIRLLSRPDPEAEWRFRQSGIFYDLRFDRVSLVQDTVSIGQAADRYWRVEMDGAASVDPGNIPVLELGWLPHELLFVARGKGPFMLAYGSARIGVADLNQNQAGLLYQVVGVNEDALLKEAALLPKIILGGPDLLTPEPPPLPWRKWLLWGVLVMGVGIIARMALSLGKGLNKEEKES